MEVCLIVYADVDGRSLARTCKGLWTQSGRRTGSSKVLHQEEGMTADTLISLVCQAMIRRIPSISKVRWGIFGCVVDEEWVDERSG
jgi:hypothetical protein